MTKCKNVNVNVNVNVKKMVTVGCQVHIISRPIPYGIDEWCVELQALVIVISNIFLIFS